MDKSKLSDRFVELKIRQIELNRELKQREELDSGIIRISTKVRLGRRVQTIREDLAKVTQEIEDLENALDTAKSYCEFNIRKGIERLIQIVIVSSYDRIVKLGSSVSYDYDQCSVLI